MMTNADFMLFYKKYRGFSRKMAKKLVRDEYIADDICQEVFASIYNMGEGLDLSNERKIYGLVKTITFNKVSDYYRRAHKKHEYNVGEITDDKSFKELSYEIDDMIMGLETHHKIKLLFQELRKKNELNYEIYIRVKIFDILPGFVVEQFNITVSNVNNRIMRTKRWLKEEYQKIAD